MIQHGMIEENAEAAEIFHEMEKYVQKCKLKLQETGSHPSWSSLLHLGFFQVHSYERVGLYQFSTVNHCRLARTQKYHYAKVTTKIAIVPLVLLLFFCETKSETMGVVRHCLCRRWWPSGARLSATRLVAKLLAIPGALFWRRNLNKGGRYA